MEEAKSTKGKRIFAAWRRDSVAITQNVMEQGQHG